MNNIKMLYYDRINISLEMLQIKQVDQKSVIFVTTGIF